MKHVIISNFKFIDVGEKIVFGVSTHPFQDQMTANEKYYDEQTTRQIIENPDIQLFVCSYKPKNSLFFDLMANISQIAAYIQNSDMEYQLVVFYTKFPFLLKPQEQQALFQKHPEFYAKRFVHQNNPQIILNNPQIDEKVINIVYEILLKNKIDANIFVRKFYGVFQKKESKEHYIIRGPLLRVNHQLDWKNHHKYDIDESKLIFSNTNIKNNLKLLNFQINNQQNQNKYEKTVSKFDHNKFIVLVINVCKFKSLNALHTTEFSFARFCKLIIDVMPDIASIQEFPKYQLAVLRQFLKNYNIISCDNGSSGSSVLTILLVNKKHVVENVKIINQIVNHVRRGSIYAVINGKQYISTQAPKDEEFLKNFMQLLLKNQRDMLLGNLNFDPQSELSKELFNNKINVDIREQTTPIKNEILSYAIPFGGSFKQLESYVLHGFVTSIDMPVIQIFDVL